MQIKLWIAALTLLPSLLQHYLNSSLVDSAEIRDRWKRDARKEPWADVNGVSFCISILVSAGFFWCQVISVQCIAVRRMKPGWLYETLYEISRDLSYDPLWHESESLEMFLSFCSVVLLGATFLTVWTWPTKFYIKRHWTYEQLWMFWDENFNN
jgi:hypothetical protein